jgi:signal transduction histidine kinase
VRARGARGARGGEPEGARLRAASAIHRARRGGRHAWHYACGALLGLAILALAAAVSLHAARWWGAPFPGFFVLANRLVPAAALPGWPTEDVAALFLAEVVAVEGRPIASSAEVYAAAAARPVGSPITYAFRRGGRTWERTIRSFTFTGSDVILVFGTYVLNGLIFGLIATAVWVLRPDLPAARGMLAFGVTTCLFALTGARVYEPSPWVLRLHMLAEALLPAAVVHLAFVFPTTRPAAARRLAIVGAWAVSGLLGLLIQVVLFDVPRALPVGNLFYLNYAAVASVFVWRMVVAYRRGSALERNKIRVVTLAVLPGSAFPAALAISGVTGGLLPVNAAAFTAFFFPLGLAYGTLRHDLFEIDTVVRRLVHYAVLTALTTLLYLAMLAVATGVLRQAIQSPLLPLHFALGVVLILLPLRDRVQRVVDRVCFRPAYDARRVLEDVSLALGSTLDIEVIAATVIARADEALSFEAGVLYLRAPDDRFRVAGGQGSAWGDAPGLGADAAIAKRLARGRVVTWYADAEAVGGPLPLGPVQAEVVVPMIFRERLVGFLALGPRRSGRYYAADDVQFLRTLANQTALSILHAEAYEELHTLTVTLEQKVADRTAELGRANAELQGSLARLGDAYRELQQSQEKLVRSEKLATLGRLAAGVAHEVSTPLGAALSSLRLARDLVAEYRESIGDPAVGAADHREIAAELDAVASRAQEWTEKAAKFILAVKAHTRGYEAAPTSTFDVERVVHETEVLLHHRMHAAGCALRLRLGPATPAVRGDPTKLGQVLTNLITNGIDAYEEAGRSGDIEIVIGADGGQVVIAVRDRGCGIAPEHQARVYEELFTTKPPGRGTGLGLAIVRDLVTNHFGGTINLESVPGGGTTFTVRLPGVAAEDGQAVGPRSAA